MGTKPAPKIAVVTCMDPRLSNLEEILGLPNTELDVIRTGGPAVTEDVLSELIFSTRFLKKTEIMLLNHTDCGFTKFPDEEMNNNMAKLTGDDSPAPMRFFAYKDPMQNTLEQIKAVRSHPWIAKEVPMRGFIFDVHTGLLSEVTLARNPTTNSRTVCGSTAMMRTFSASRDLLFYDGAFSSSDIFPLLRSPHC